MTGNKQWNSEQYSFIQREYQNKNGLTLLNRLEEYTDLRAQYILDLGCGDGHLSQALYKRTQPDGMLTGIDLDDGMIRVAQINYSQIPRMRFINSGIQDFFTQERQSYDIIYSNAVLHWINSFSDLVKIFESSADHLNPGGYLALRFSILGHADQAKDFLEKCIRNYNDDSSITLKRATFESEKIIKTLEALGLNILSSEELTFEAFKDNRRDLDWIIYSQPLLQFFNESEYTNFVKYVSEKYQKNPVTVQGRHIQLIVKK